MPRPQNILIFGATGTIGRFITQELNAAKSSFSRIGIFTSQATSQTKAAELQAWKEKGVNILIGDISSEEDVLNAYKGNYKTIHGIKKVKRKKELKKAIKATTP